MSVTISVSIADSLNKLLANLQVYYQTLQGLHWNIRGKQFFELHEVYGDMYADIQPGIDAIAERILAIGGKPIHTFEEYTTMAVVKVGKNISKDSEGIELIIDSLKQLIKIEKVILKKSTKLDDQGTMDMMIKCIGNHEKTIWKMSSWLEKEV